MAHRVAIVGGGFGGLYAAKALRKAPVEITLIDRRNFHLFQPLLYQAATGELSPADIAYPLRSIFGGDRNVRVLLAHAIDVDPAARHVVLDDGDFVPYDTLVVATGSENHYFGSRHWEEFAPGLKSLEEATRIRHKILYAFEAAERETDPAARRAWLTFVVAGAGATGVELAGALGEIANDTLKGDFRAIRPEEARIILVDGSDRVLTPYHPRLSAAAEKALIRLGVRTRLNVKVTGVDKLGVDLETPAGPDRIEARTVLWAAGVRGSAFAGLVAERTGTAKDRGGRIMVGPDCSLPSHPEIFAVGDIAHLPGKDGKPLPGVAPTAMQQGRYVARVIAARLEGKTSRPFRYLDKGSLAVIGRARAVAQFGGVDGFKFSGLFAWLLWLFVHLMYLVNFQNRIVVFIRWAFQYATFNRGARLITGEPVDKVPNPNGHSNPTNGQRSTSQSPKVQEKLRLN